MDYNNKKVKINVAEILSRKRGFSKKYITFLLNNENTVFTAETYSRRGVKKNDYYYTLKEDDTGVKWIFTADDFILEDS